MLQTVLGFDAGSIASAFLVAPAAMSQRLVRAKAKIRQAGIPFGVPGTGELPERLDAVLAAIYAAYAEGWVDAEGADARRRNLAEEAIWLGRLLVHLLPQQAEALGLLALMLHAHARRAARRDAAGDYVPLGWQDTARWEHAMIDEAEALLQRASALGVPGRYQLEAAVQSAHAVRRHGMAVPWPAIVQLYEGLAAITQSPVAALNRAVALSHVQGAQAGLGALPDDARLAEYQPYWAARADLLARAGDRVAAAAAYARAIGLESDSAVRRFLQQRAAGLGGRE
jgi:RNA polymerase sigma-70 factor, ECF subfamily